MQCCTSAMGRSKAPSCDVSKLHAMLCNAFSNIIICNFSPEFGISQLYIVQFSNGFKENDGHLIHIHVI